MRTMRKPVLTVVLLIILFALDSCGKKQQQAPPPVTTSGAVGAASGVVALPNFTALVKKEGPAVVNISTTQKIRREQFYFRHFLAPSKMIYSMSSSAGLRLARCFRMNFVVSRLVPVLSLARTAIFLPMLMSSRIRTR